MDEHKLAGMIRLGIDSEFSKLKIDVAAIRTILIGIATELYVLNAKTQGLPLHEYMPGTIKESDDK